MRTDLFPAKLYYIEHLDEVWVLCWNSDKNTGSKTIVVIKEASSDTRHSMVHTQPIGYKFDLVNKAFRFLDEFSTYFLFKKKYLNYILI